MIDLQLILTQVKSLPTLAPVVVQLASLATDESASASDFERVIRPDPALTANLLKLANAAYFGCRRQVTSVRQAVGLLGVKRVYEVATGAAFTKVIPGALAGYGITSEAYWLHSVAVAVFAERFAKELGIHVPELTFTAGLLHNIGKLVISSFLHDHSAELLERLKSGPVLFVQAEREILGVDHCEVGASVAESWNLPRAIGQSVRWHHEPNLSDDPSFSELVRLVHVANGLAHMMGFGGDTGGLARRLDPQVVASFGITPHHLECIASDGIDEIRSLGKLFADSSGGLS
jgi:putative nucleotidyltransferase with HDIG domain